MPLSLPSEVHDLLTLHLVPGLGPRLTAALLDRFGSARAVLQASQDELRQVPHIGPQLAESFYQAIRNADTAGELDLIAKHNVHLLTLGTPDYPGSLATIPGPPPLLYARGSLEAGDAKAVALVGSRQCTSYGKRIAQRLATDLVRAGYTIVSGLARGIDGAAHRGALLAGGRTVAVLAGGLSRIYPPEHADLAAEVEASGALLSEATMRQEPLAAMFPARNRLISGLSRGIVLVEAAEHSGALITARHAAEQGRPVFAVPGPVDNPASAGALGLIRNGATLIRGAEDILEELEGVQPPTLAAAPPAVTPTGLDAVQQKTWDYLGDQPRHLDEIAQHLGVGVAQLSGALFTMELKKVIRRLPGNRYERG